MPLPSPSSHCRFRSECASCSNTQSLGALSFDSGLFTTKPSEVGHHSPLLSDGFLPKDTSGNGNVHSNLVFRTRDILYNENRKVVGFEVHR